MTVNPESEVVRTAYDSISRNSTYTIRRGDRHWTVQIHQDDFDKCGPDKMKRRNLLANRLEQAVLGLSDEEKAA